MEKWPLVLYPPLQSPCVLCDSRAIYSSHSNRLWALPCDLIDFCCPPCCCLRSALSQLSTPSFHSFHSLPIHFYPFQSLKNMHHTPSTSATSASAFFSAPQSEAHTSWNADTGASAHMTFNRHWIRNLKPYRVQIRLADGSVVYSEGVGSVRFNPVVNGQEMRPLEFSNVLYVPALSTNLFSVLYLTLHHHFIVSIEKDTIHFIRDNRIAFQAKTGPSNAAYLLGDTIPVEEFASLSSATTLPLDWYLWHRRLCHHHLAGIKKLLSGNLVTGFKLDSQASPDPVCEVCKVGKMHADPFPISTSRTSKLLQLVHSDVHGPVKVPTHQGYHFSSLPFTSIHVSFTSPFCSFAFNPSCSSPSYSSSSISSSVPQTS